MRPETVICWLSYLTAMLPRGADAARSLAKTNDALSGSVQRRPYQRASFVPGRSYHPETQVCQVKRKVSRTVYRVQAAQRARAMVTSVHKERVIGQDIDLAPQNPGPKPEAGGLVRFGPDLRNATCPRRRGLALVSIEGKGTWEIAWPVASHPAVPQAGEDPCCAACPAWHAWSVRLERLRDMA